MTDYVSIHSLDWNIFIYFISTRNFVCFLLRNQRIRILKLEFSRLFSYSCTILSKYSQGGTILKTETSVQYCQNLHMLLHQCTICNMNNCVQTFTHFCNDNYDNCTTFASCKTNSGIWSLDNSLKLGMLFLSISSLHNQNQLWVSSIIKTMNHWPGQAGCNDQVWWRGTIWSQPYASVRGWLDWYASMQIGPVH